MSKTMAFRADRQDPAGRGDGAGPNRTGNGDADFLCPPTGATTGSAQGILIHCDFEIVFVNESWAGLFGYTADEIYALGNLASVIAPRHRARLTALSEARLAGKPAPPVIQWAGIHRNGREFASISLESVVIWRGQAAIQITTTANPDYTETQFEDCAAPIMVSELQRILVDSNTEAELLAQSLHATSERQREAREAYLAHEDRFRDFTEIAADWFWETDELGRITYLSPRFEEVLGFSPGSLIGRTRGESLVALNARVTTTGDSQAAIAGEELFRNFEFERDMPNGEIRHFAMRGRRWTGSDGQFCGYRGIGRDVTELRAAERTLRASEAHTRAIMDYSGSLMWMKDLEGRYVQVNGQFKSVYGIGPGDIEGKRDADYFPPEDAARFQAADAAVIQSRAATCSEPGSEKWSNSPYLVTRFPVFDADGKLMGVGGIATDVSEQRRTQTALRHSEERLRALIDHSPSAISIKDPDGRFLVVNRQFERHFNTTGEEMLGRTLRDVYQGPELDRLTEQDREVIEHRREVVEEISFSGRPSRPTMLSVKFPILDGDGQVLAIGAIGTDISAQKRAQARANENELRSRSIAEAMDRQKNLLQGIFDHVPDAIVFADQSHTILMVNAGTTRLFGYPAEALLGCPGKPALYNQLDWTTTSHKAAGGSDVTPPVYREFERADGTRFPGEASYATVRDHHGAIIGFLATIRDISERIQTERERDHLEAQLRQSQKMQAVGQLTGGIAHDFNNILSSVMGYTGLAIDFCVEEPESQLGRYLDEVQRAAERARDLVAQMLTFSRGGSGEPEILEPTALVHEAITLLHSTLPTSLMLDVEVEKEISSIELEPVQLQQLLMNLCINARDAMDGKGLVQVKLYETEVSDQRCSSCNGTFDGAMVVLEVTDSGPGLSDEVRARIFEPFFTTKEVGRGSGMGLPMVHGILHRHGGHIVVNDAVTQGLSIRLYFPTRVAPSESKLLPHHDATDSTEKGGRVLVVDDEPSIANFLSELLRIKGYEVRTHHSTWAALSEFNTDPNWPDLLLTDQTMPGANGTELIYAVRDQRPDLPVILCTGHSDKVTDEDARSWGQSAFLNKPLTSHRLLATIEHLLTNEDQHNSQPKAARSKPDPTLAESVLQKAG